MSDSHGGHPIPRSVLIGAGLLVATTILLSGIASRTGLGTSEMPASPPIRELELRFEDRSDGAVTVLEAETGRVVAVLPPGSNGFVRGVLRALARERKLREVGPEQPFHLARRADGRLSLTDPSTGQRIDLDSFGPTNLRAFENLLDARPERAPSPGGTS